MFFISVILGLSFRLFLIISKEGEVDCRGFELGLDGGKERGALRVRFAHWPKDSVASLENSAIAGIKEHLK